MTKQPPDFSFTRRGRPLASWLPELVSDDPATRLAAGEALQAMWSGLPSGHTDLAEIDWGPHAAVFAGQGDRFRDEIRATLGSRAFPASDFVRKLILFRVALREEDRRRIARGREEDEAPNIHRDRLLQRLEAAKGEVEGAEAARRYFRWVAANMARTWKRGRKAASESTTPPGFLSYVVFEALDVALMADRPGLLAMLSDEGMRRDALGALTRIGPPAVDFAPILFERLDASTRSGYSQEALALGSIGRDDPVVIDGLLRRLRSGPSSVRPGAATALGRAGPPLAGRVEVAIDLLLGATEGPEINFAAIPALASVGRDSEVALRRILELAEPRPPRFRTDEDSPHYRYDEVLRVRGAAIDSLRHFKRFADRVIPVLVDAIDTYEEYDPDRCDSGDHGRACAGLQPFGPWQPRRQVGSAATWTSGGRARRTNANGPRRCFAWSPRSARRPP